MQSDLTQEEKAQKLISEYTAYLRQARRYVIYAQEYSELAEEVRQKLADMGITVPEDS